jgi:chemotaxis protein histidine kinase CheA
LFYTTAQGGTVDRITEMMDSLSELDSDKLADLQQTIISEFESVEKSDITPETVDAMKSLADMLDSVRTELKQREAAVQELAQRAAEAASRVYGDDKKEDGEMPESDEAKEGDTDMEKSPEMAAPVMEEEKKEEAPAPAEEVPAAPADSAPAAEEAPVAETDAEKEKEEEKKPMTEASTESEKTVELSTETTETAEVAPVATEAQVVTASAEEEAAPAAEASADVAEEAPASDADADAASDDAADAAADVADGAEASIQETQTNEPVVVQETMEAPVTAAANADDLTPEVPADRRPVAQVSAAPVAITAGADIPGLTAGSPLSSMDDVAEAFSKRIHALRRVNGGDGEQHIVASVSTSFPEERTLSTDAEANWAKIQKVVSPEAIVAAGGHVAPFEVRYDIFGLGTTARPVRDALPRFQADRGGIRYIVPPVLTDYANAVGVWTAANDAATTPNPAAKASLTVAAASETTVATDAVTLQMQFGNLATRAYPELIARHNELGLIQHAREAEQNLLAKIAAGSTAVTTSSLIGFGRDFLVQVGRAATAYRSRHRLEADASLRIIIPAWVKDAMAADLALNMPGDSTLNAYSEIDGYLAARGVVVSYSLDQDVFGAQGATALVEFTDSFTWYLFAEGTFLFLDGGTLDLGIIRDSSLVGTNDYKMFVETFEGVAKVGIEGLAITSTISINGVAAALRDTTGGATAAAVEY